MSGASLVTHLTDENSNFREDAPRPPVPGEEGQASCQFPLKNQRSKSMSLSTNHRRNEDGLGEPEGSASPDSPLVRWTKSLLSLLGDQDGAHLFRTFLEREKCVDTLDFWFACNGFRQMDLKDAKTLRVAKAIHKRYIENYSIVSKQLKPPTKVFIRDCIKKQQIDSTMFDQAQAEIQTVMEDNAYQMFLTSDIYLDYVRTGGENTAYFNNVGPGSLKLVSGYLPTLNEEEELNCVDLKHKSVPSVVGLSSKALRATASSRAKEGVDNCYRSYKKSDLINPYHVNSGYVFAPATSANESEISSDAMTDDSMSMTDSSVDGIPPYRTGSKKQLQREMQRSVKANGQVSLPHFPRSHRLPREMTPVEPAVFAAELIARLEKVKQEQETMETLEERLQQIKEEEEREECETPMCFQPICELSMPLHQPLALVSSVSCEDDPQAILDDHLSRVLKTPGCQSPGVGRACSPDRTRVLRPTLSPVSPSVPCPMLTKSFVTKQTTKHVHHHYIHHHTVPKTKEEIEAEAARRVQCFCTSSADYCCYLRTRAHPKGVDLSLLHMDTISSRAATLSKRNYRMASDYSGEGGVDGTTILCQLPVEEHLQTTWHRVAEFENERQSKHRSHSAQNTKKNTACETTRASSAERPARHHQWNATSSHPRNQQPLHTLVQDVAAPAVTPSNTLAQLEEACRRLAEVSKPPKQRGPTSSHQRSHSVPCQAGSVTPMAEDHKEPKKLQNGSPHPSSELTVTYFFCGEEIPYRRMLKSHSLTLGHFKEQLSKKGNYRYYFKKASQEFDCGAVFEEIREDDTILPTYEGRVLGKVERID